MTVFKVIIIVGCPPCLGPYVLFEELAVEV
jgi:hypothetical protein